MITIYRSIISGLFSCLLLAGCSGIYPTAAGASPKTPAIPAEINQVDECPVIKPVWIKPPEDAAVMNPPEFGYYHVNADRSIWASAWWSENEAFPLRAGKEGNKIGWFRPAGVELVITGQRLDAKAPPLEAHASCCYPTRFQASGLYFPTAGCWEITATAAESLITFVVEVEPSE